MAGQGRQLTSAARVTAGRFPQVTKRTAGRLPAPGVRALYASCIGLYGCGVVATVAVAPRGLAPHCGRATCDVT